jgi:hypothetical protein
MRITVVVAALASACGGESSRPDATNPAVLYSLDPSFGVDGIATIPLSVENGTDVKFLPTNAGLVIATGTRAGELALCRLTTQGVLDPTYGGANTGCFLGPGLATLAAVTDGTDIFVATQSEAAVPTAGPAIFRFRGDGTLDTTWGTNGAIALSPPPPSPPDTSTPYVARLSILSNNTLIAWGVYGRNNSGGESWFQRVIGSTVDSSVLLPRSADPFARVVVSTTGSEISLLATFVARLPTGSVPHLYRCLPLRSLHAGSS